MEVTREVIERLMLDRPIKDYHFVAQAEISIDGVDDKEEMLLSEVSFVWNLMNVLAECDTRILTVMRSLVEVLILYRMISRMIDISDELIHHDDT